MEELWQCMVRAGWPGRLLGEDEDPEVAPKDFVVLDPEPVPWHGKMEDSM